MSRLSEQQIQAVEDALRALDPDEGTWPTGEQIEAIAAVLVPGLVQVELTPAQATTLVLFANRGYTRELGAIDPRMSYTEDETAAMKARFAAVCEGIAAIESALRNG